MGGTVRRLNADGPKTDLRDPKSGWSEIGDVDLKALPNLATYYVRLVDATGAPVLIGRLLRPDDRGLLYIGMTQAEGPGRIKGLIEDVRKPSAKPRHGLGKKLWRTRLIQRLRDGQSLQVGWTVHASRKDAEGRERAGQIDERDAIQSYFTLHGELPPLNHQLPGFLSDGDPVAN